jgi:hypothetical protein
MTATNAAVMDCSPSEYHKLRGFFSSTIAKTLTSRSERHAKDSCDRNEEEDEEDLTDQQLALRERGNILHSLVLGKGQRIEVVPFGDYRTKAAKEARDSARALGHIPVKQTRMDDYLRAAGVIKSRILEAGHDAFESGVSELAIKWIESSPHGPVQCKGMLDKVCIWGLDGKTGAPEATIYDLKFVGDAEPSLNERTAEKLGYSIQSAAYTRALAALYPQLAGRIEFRFLFVEAKRPYDIWDPKPDGVFRQLGESRWINGVQAWARGLSEGTWPGYRGRGRSEISVPVWRLREEGISADG